MSKKYLTATELSTWVRCNRMFMYSRIYPNYNQNMPVLLSGINHHNRHAKGVWLQKIVVFLIFMMFLIVLVAFWLKR